MDQPSIQALDENPIHWALRAAQLLWRALTRLWGRDVMLYTGGVSFFSLLAIFPALAILVTLYSLLSSPLQAEREGELLALVIPEGARSIVQQEL
ncbi:MAG TPA: YhjD/YihY/BrkB family envelope integrity protein, partial [Caulobacteraceae bacterium]